MRRFLAYSAGGLLMVLGVGMVALYALLVTHAIGSLDDPNEAGVLAGSGAGFAIAGGFVIALLPRRRGGEIVRHMRAPALWLSALVFGLAIAVGAYAVRSARYPGFDPALAVLAVAATFLFVVRLVTRWGPRRSVSARAVLGSAAWGMSAAVVIALVLELLFFGAVVGAIYVGLYAADPDVARSAWSQGISDKIDSAGGEIARTWTIALAAMVMYALVAPLVEEFSKMVGVLVVMRGRVLTPYAVFVAGISAGLGFAVLETLLYGLASADKWPLIIGLRAPIVLVHATGASLSALGWRLQQERGGFALVWHYAIAVLVHASWNGLTVALLIASATSSAGDSLSLATGLTTLTVLALMALVLVSCLIWVVMNARRFGRAASDAQREREQRASAHAPVTYERGGAFTGAVASEV